MDPCLRRQRWENLTGDLLIDIAGRLRCIANRAHMSRVCTSWAKAVNVHPPPRQLPWLLLPYRGTRRLPPNVARTAAFFCFLDRSIHYLRVGEDTRGARFFGSYGKGWLFLAQNQISGHALVNVNTGRRISLPDSISSVVDGRRRTESMVILAATLSISPSVPTEQCGTASLSSPPVTIEPCVAAAIVTTLGSPGTAFYPREIAFLRLGHDPDAFSWTRFDAPGFSYQDVIYHNGAFHFLTLMLNVLVCRPEFREEAGLVVHSELRRFRMDPPWPVVSIRYLVESRGELLMVVRYNLLQIPEFRVYRSTQQKLPDGEVVPCWLRTHHLDGRMLFIARGCSRSYEVADFPGSVEDGIYFLDDRSFDDVAKMSRKQNYRKYNCNKNGCWSEPPRSCFSLGALSSNYSYPMWFLP